MRKKPPVIFALLLLSLICSTFVFSTSATGNHAGGPTLLKRTVAISAKRYLRYWPNPTAAEPKYNTWSWAPQVEFQILGPVPGGSQWMFDVATPDGKPWVSFKLPTQEVGNDELITIKGPDMDQNELEKKAITQTGLFPFKITLKNALAGTNEAIFSGKFKVATYAPDQAIPEYKGKQEFYVVQDWHLPIGYIWFDPRQNENVPVISVQMWFRGTSSGEKMEGVLFYKGQQIATANGNNEQELATGVADPQGRWGLWQFPFSKARGFNHDTSANNWSGVFFLDKNPGDYEVKILRQEKLARSATFSVGADGRIVDNGIARQNNLGGIRMVLPVKVIGDQDLHYDPLSWKTDAMYGNGLPGFTAP